jgi:hypothetical protein
MANPETQNQRVLPAVRLGAIKNHLGILSDDGKKLRPQNLIRATGLGAAELSKYVQKQRPQLYREEIPLSDALRKRIIQLVMATDIVFELLNKNLDETKSWMMVPNTVTFGDSPFEVCMRGDGETLIGWLRDRGAQA